MPLYEYEIADSPDNWIYTVELWRPIDHRDWVPEYLKRVEIPARLSTPMGWKNPTDVDQAMPYALRQLECGTDSHYFDKFKKNHGFSKNDLRRIWSEEWTSTVE